jgi:hypothetical protein
MYTQQSRHHILMEKHKKLFEVKLVENIGYTTP